MYAMKYKTSHIKNIWITFSFKPLKFTFQEIEVQFHLEMLQACDVFLDNFTQMA